MSNVWDFAANVGSNTAAMKSRAQGKTPARLNTFHMNPFDIESEPFGDENDLETALIDKQQWSPKELSLLQRIRKSKIYTEEDLLAEEAQEREVQMEAMGKDFVKVHEVFKDLEEIISSQDSDVQQVQDGATAAHARAQDGVSQIKKATKNQKRSFSCAFIALSSFAGIVVLVTIVVVLGSKYGSLFL